MKKNLIMLCGWVAMTFAACTNDDLPIVIEQPNQAGEEVLVTAYAAGDDTPDSRISSTYDDANEKYTFTWDNNDTFSVIRDGVNETFTKTNGGENEFSGVKPGSTGDFYAIYPETTATDHTMATFDISTQTNNAAYVMYATSADGDVYHFKHAMSFLRFTLPEGLNGTTFDITITTPTGVFTTGIINLTDGSISYDGSIKNTISLEDRTAYGTILVAIPPMPAGSNKRLSFWVKSDSGKYYEGTLSGNSEKAIKAGKYYTASLSLTETDIPYLTFTAQGEQTFKMNTELDYTLPESLEYSVGGSAWAQLNAGESITFGGANGNLRLRGKSSTGTATSAEAYSKIVFGNNTPVACTGDIRTLVDWENYENANTSNARFCYLFKGCSVLTTAPALPATSLADLCYLEMFRDCTSLTAVPATLPATSLADLCYTYMFSGCTSLATAPALPATTLAKYCYAYMFYGCTSLATAPALPAITLKDFCYNFMFQGCTSLATAPDLPATTLAEGCYQSMFYGCTSLTTAPTLSATTLADFCYAHMFRGCTSLTAAPALPATTLKNNCYAAMFLACTSLETAPALQATTLVKNCYAYMFKNCTSLTAAPATLPATSLAENCYNQMFYGCSELNSITMLATNISASNCLYEWVNGVSTTGTFTKAAAMTSLPTGINGIPEGWAVQDYSVTP